MNEQKVMKLRKHEDNLKIINDYDLSNPNEVLKAQKFLEDCFKGVLDDFKDVKDRFLVLMIYYDLTEKKEFSYLRPFYKQTYERFFDTNEHLQNYFDVLQNEELLKSVLDNVSDETLKTIYNYTKDINELFLKNNDKKYVDMYNKIEKVCVLRKIIEPPLVIKSDLFENESILKEDHDKKILSDISYEAQQKGKMSENFTNAANAIGVNNEDLINIVGEDAALKVDQIIVDNAFLEKLAANSAIVATKPNNVFMRLLNKVNNKNTLRSVDFDIVDINGVNTLLLSREDTTLDKIANCSKNVLDSIVNSVKKRKTLSKIIEKCNPKVVKEAIVNTNNKVVSYLNGLRSKESVDVDSTSKDTIDDSYYDQVYNIAHELNLKDPNYVIKKATVEPTLSTNDFINETTGVTHMQERQRYNWNEDSALANMTDEQMSDYIEEARRNNGQMLADEIIKGRSK